MSSSFVTQISSSYPNVFQVYVLYEVNYHISCNVRNQLQANTQPKSSNEYFSQQAINTPFSYADDVTMNVSKNRTLIQFMSTKFSQFVCPLLVYNVEVSNFDIVACFNIMFTTNTVTLIK